MALEYAQQVLQEALKLIYDSAYLHDMSPVDDGKGGSILPPENSIPVFARLDSVLDWMRLDTGYSEKDVAVFILRTNDLEINKDYEVTLNSRRYKIGSFREDPLRVSWECRAVPTRG